MWVSLDISAASDGRRRGGDGRSRARPHERATIRGIVSHYLVSCRTVELEPGKFLVTVFAVHDDGAGAGVREATTSESRLFESAELARAEAPRMMAAMRERLAAGGHRVRLADPS